MTDPGVGTEVAGYRIEAELGRGGMGVVYRARDERLGRSVAFKVIAPGQAADPAFRERFIAESRAAAAIDHPNVLPVYEAGEEGETLFLAARLVEGADLGELLKGEGALAPERALAIVAQVGAALDAAHARGLIHRDVKPANVLIAAEASAEGTEHAYLTDFGLAKRSDAASGLTATGQFVGTLDYIAPEQIQGSSVDARVDVYALTALFHECLTGAPPFRRDTQAALMWAHLNDPPPSLSERAAGAPPALDAVIARGMAKAPDERFRSCAELVAAARGTLAGGPAPAPPTVAAGAGAPGTVAAGGAVAGQEAGLGAEAPATGDVTVAPSPEGPALREPAPARRAPGLRRLLAGAIVAGAVLIGALAWVVIGSGGGGEPDGGGPTAVLGLASETAGLASGVGRDTGRLAARVDLGQPSGGLAGSFEESAQRASVLGDEAQAELSGDDPGRDDLDAAIGGLAEASTRLTEVAEDPTGTDAAPAARQARTAMNGAIDGLQQTLIALRDAFEAEGADDAAATVGESLERLRDNEGQLTGAFDELVAAL